jgi:predicted GNAT family acetyltransferase
LIKIVTLTHSLEPIFWEHINKDVPHYYFFAFDWKYNRDKTKILLTLDGNRIDGMMLVYNQSIVQLRGSHEAAKALFEKLDLEKIELQASDQHKQCILEKYKPTWSHQMMLMALNKGEERFQKKHLVEELGVSDGARVAAVMRDADPEYWGDLTGQQIVNRMNQGVIWLGVKVNQELVSLGSTRLTEWAGLIGVIATQKAHRNRGYATSIVSELVKRILGKQSTALIYVLVDNQPAIRAYSKVGFEPYRRYFFMRGERY